MLQIVGWGGKLSFQCLRPSASLRAAGKNTFSKNLKIDYIIFKYFLTSKMSVLSKIRLMVIHLCTAYLKRRITSSA
jgi:hypothetical protein